MAELEYAPDKAGRRIYVKNDKWFTDVIVDEYGAIVMSIEAFEKMAGALGFVRTA